MAMQFVGWGRWGSKTINKYLLLCREKKQAQPLFARRLDEDDFKDDYDAGHFPDPVSAETYFSSKVGFAAHSQDGMGDRVHFLNIGENFATGAMSAYLKTAPAYRESIDIVVAYMPPPGANPATAGRFLANMLGSRNFAEILILLDGTAPFFCDSDEDEISAFAAGAGQLLQAFERSCCMIPLLRRMNARSFSLGFCDIRRINADSSLQALFSNLTVRTSPGRREFLAFSFSDNRENNLAQIYQRNIPRDRLLYIPFARRYEWGNICLPPSLGGRHVKNFTGIFCANVLPERVLELLDRYEEAYWPEQGRQRYERPEPAIADWLKRNRLIMGPENIQSIEVLAAARKFAYDIFVKFEEGK